ncbi:MAG: hypothetical protein IPL52_03265 [Flavobacteriales bacterium]|nr:hypothetical protein [Flavobacteriales bacterium]
MVKKAPAMDKEAYDKELNFTLSKIFGKGQCAWIKDHNRFTRNILIIGAKASEDAMPSALLPGKETIQEVERAIFLYDLLTDNLEQVEKYFEQAAGVWSYDGCAQFHP